MPGAGIRLAAEAAQLPVLQAWLQDCWQRQGLPPAEAFAFELALEEVFMNVAMHGAPAGLPPPFVDCLLEADGQSIALVVEDEGLAFNPLQQDSPDVAAALEDRPIGGLGIHLVRQMMDEVSYEHTGQRNRLLMRKRRA